MVVLMTVFARVGRFVSRRRLAARLVGLFLVVAGVAAALTACDQYITDTNAPLPPRITDFTVRPDSLDLTDAGDTAVATVGARAGVSVDSVRVRFRGPDSALARECVARAPDTGEPTDGTWSCSLGLDRFDPEGAWEVVGLQVLADTGTVLDIDSTALADAGYPRIIAVIRRALMLDSVSVDRDTVSTYQDTARVTVRAMLHGPRLDSVTMAMARGEVQLGCTAGTPEAGTRGDGEWACDVTFPRGAFPGDWPVSEVRAYPAGLDPSAFGPDTLAALGAPDVTVAVPPISFVVVTTARDTLTAPGDTTRATARAYDELEQQVSGVSFSWTSTDTAVAAVDGQGLVTARGAGSAWVRAATSGVSDSSRVVVQFAPLVDSVGVTPAADTVIDRGDTTRFSFTAWDTAGTALDTSAIWWVEDTVVASVDSTGLVTTRAGGETRVLAALGPDTAWAALRVAPISFITLSPYGTTRRAVADTFRYQARFYTGYERLIGGIKPTWVSSDTTVATVDSTGQVVPLQPGTTTVSVAAEGVTVSRTVEVVDVAGIDVTPNPFAFDSVGQVQAFTATATDSGGDTVDVVVHWATADTTVATASYNGYATAQGRGSTVVRATAGAITGEANVTVAAVDSVALEPAADTILARGDTARLTFRAFTAAGTELGDAPDAWWSSDTGVATVDATGRVTSVAGGTATIMAALGSDTAAATIHVPPVDFVTVNPYADTIYAIGDTFQYYAMPFTHLEQVIPGVELTWSSADPTIATIDTAGRAMAVAPGSTTVTVTAEGVSASRPLWVVPVDSVVVSPETYYFEFLGNQKQFTAVALSASGDTLNADIEWTSLDTTVVQVSPSGLATAAGQGQTELWAAAEGGAATGTVGVTSDVITSILVFPSSDTLTAIGDTARYTATAFAGPQILTGIDFIWTTGDTTVATVDSTGLVTAVDSGSTQVTALAAPDMGSATVDVVAQPAMFTVVDLGWLGAGPGPEDVALGISQGGQVAGMAMNDAGDYVPFWWNADQGMLEIPTLGSTDSTYGAAYDINSATFAIVGESTHDSGTIQAFYFIPTDGLVAIGDLEGLGSRARAVNDSLAIVGGSMTASGQEHAFLWTETGGMQDLGTLGGALSMALDINNAGTVVGYSWVAADQPHAFVWSTGGGMMDLGTLGGGTSYATGINQDGVVTGYAENGAGEMRAVVWLPPYDGAPTELGTLGGPESFAWDIATSGAVGDADPEAGAAQPVFYTGDLSIYPVTVEGATIETLRAVNAANQMAGAATISGSHRAVRIDTHP